jgi:hypothetical protein
VWVSRCIGVSKCLTQPARRRKFLTVLWSTLRCEEFSNGISEVLMSEYQHTGFQAVDRPLNDKQLAFAERQSSRSEVSGRSQTVKHHDSDFRGNVDGLLRPSVADGGFGGERS